ncbi:SGT1 protein-domain-containing protein [Parasitella parasitica]|nr:SGT1 protein-domain-containing protein [Parasitella parasitica]
MKACASMKEFSPQRGLTETVIQFTKTTYAQTVSQKFYAPKPFRLPSVREKKQFKLAELGMKVACGLEMLYHSAPSAHDGYGNERMETYDFDNDKNYMAYVAHLTKLGYFRSERKGSHLYGLLEKQSKEQYLQYKLQVQNEMEKRYVSLDNLDAEDPETFEGSCNTLSNSQNVKQRIDSLLSLYSEEALDELLRVNRHVEDSDDWMNVDPQQLEELLMKRMGHMNQSMVADLQRDVDGAGGGTTFKNNSNLEESMDLESIMANLENFVESSKSGIDGVEFPSENDHEEEEESDYDDEDDVEDEGAVQFNLDKFMSILRGTSPFATEQTQDLSNVMEEMDQEIYSHDKISGSFAKLSTAESNGNGDEDEEDVEAPVNVQLNLVKNVLESFKSQQGLPGPVGNILNQLGFVLPGDNEQDE